MKRPVIITHISSFIVISSILLLIYATVRHSFRSGPSDSQIQKARDMASRLKAKAYSVNNAIEITNYLSPFVIFYDAAEKPVQSSARIDGKLHQVPGSVQENAKTHGENELTWRLCAGVQITMIVISITSPYPPLISIGKTLEKMERRESR